VQIARAHQSRIKTIAENLLRIKRNACHTLVATSVAEKTNKSATREYKAVSQSQKKNQETAIQKRVAFFSERKIALAQNREVARNSGAR
jgi:hypothetical protein